MKWWLRTPHPQINLGSVLLFYWKPRKMKTSTRYACKLDVYPERHTVTVPQGWQRRWSCSKTVARIMASLPISPVLQHSFNLGLQKILLKGRQKKTDSVSWMLLSLTYHLYCQYLLRFFGRSLFECRDCSTLKIMKIAVERQSGDIRHELLLVLFDGMFSWLLWCILFH